MSSRDSSYSYLLRSLQGDDFEAGVRWRASAFGAVQWQPRVDVYQAEDGLWIQVEAPGLDQEHLRLRYDDGRLVVEGTRLRPAAGTPCRCLQMEIEYGPFRRVLPLPFEAEAEAIEARYEAGLLLIRVPRRQTPPAVTTRITVE